MGNVSSSETQSQDSVSGVIGDISIDKKVTTTDIAADFAMQTNMPIASNVSNLSISLSKEKRNYTNRRKVASKPQIVQPTRNLAQLLIIRQNLVIRFRLCQVSLRFLTRLLNGLIT